MTKETTLLKLKCGRKASCPRIPVVVLFLCLILAIRQELASINLSLWAYPLDTITIKETVYDRLQPMPSGGIADVTTIYYKIENSAIQINAMVDSADQINREVLPSKYLLLIHGRHPMFIRDIEVIQGHWSIVKIQMNLGIYHSFDWE